MNKILIGLALIVSTTGYAQNCNCMEEYKWVKKTFEENDAGYSYYLEKYGKQAIEYNNIKWEKEFKKAEDVWQCNDFLNAWIKFYRKGHIAVAMADQTKVRPATKQKNSKGSNGAELPELTIDINSFQASTKLLKEFSYEGIWTNETYTVGIKKVKDEYIGFVITSKNEQWKAGQIKFSFPSENSSAKESVYYMGNHSLAQNQFEPCQLIGKTYLKAFDIYWKRISPDFETEPEIEEEISLMSTPGFYIKKIDSLTTVFRIPSFDNSFITTIDSLVESNHSLLITTTNLIIDIRGNGGGADRAYDSITPYLYTNPIRSMWVEFLSTPLNNARYDWIIKLDGFSEKERQDLRKMQTKLNANIGKYVNLSESNQTFVVDTLPMVYQNPQHVAILIDGANGSTAEQFILMAKQSKKVKLFGQRTAGALDFSNLNNVASPSGNFKLFYTTSRSFRIPEMAIDDYGIQPDYFIDKSIPTYKWMEFANEVMKAN